MAKEKKKAGKQKSLKEEKGSCSKENIIERLRRPGVFGYMWPVISTIVGLFFLIVLVWIIRIVNNELNSNLLSLIMSFLIDNMALMLIISLTWGYGEYLYRFDGTKAIGPLLSAIGGSLFLLFITNITRIVDSELLGEKISGVLVYVEANILMFFVLFLVTGYIKFFVDMNKGLRKVQ